MTKAVIFDTETTGLKSLEAELVGIAFSWVSGKGYYLSLPQDQVKTKTILDDFKPFFENKSIEKIGHNLKYDLKVLRKYDYGEKEYLNLFIVCFMFKLMSCWKNVPRR